MNLPQVSCAHMLLDTSTGISDQTTAGEGTLVPQAKVCLENVTMHSDEAGLMYYKIKA